MVFEEQQRLQNLKFGFYPEVNLKEEEYEKTLSKINDSSYLDLQKSNSNYGKDIDTILTYDLNENDNTINNDNLDFNQYYGYEQNFQFNDTNGGSETKQNVNEVELDLDDIKNHLNNDNSKYSNMTKSQYSVENNEDDYNNFIDNQLSKSNYNKIEKMDLSNSKKLPPIPKHLLEKKIEKKDEKKDEKSDYNSLFYGERNDEKFNNNLPLFSDDFNDDSNNNKNDEKKEEYEEFFK
jgi:hypothetical protein